MTESTTYLSKLIPHQSWLDDYVPRQLTGGIWDLDLLHKARSEAHNVLLEGPTGSAKTSVARAYASREEVPFVRISVSKQIEQSQMFGKWIPTEDGHFVWQDGPVTAVIRNGGVLVIDEINAGLAANMIVLHPLLDAERAITLLDHNGEVVEAHEDLLIIATMNPGYEGTRPLSFAMRNRFKYKLPWDYSREVEMQLVSRITTLIDIAHQLRASHRNGDIVTPISTNMLMEFEDTMLDEQLGYEFAVGNFVAAFDDDERDSVRQVLDLHSSKLKAQIKQVLDPDPYEKETSEQTAARKATMSVTSDPIREAYTALKKQT